MIVDGCRFSFALRSLPIQPFLLPLNSLFKDRIPFTVYVCPSDASVGLVPAVQQLSSYRDPRGPFQRLSPANVMLPSGLSRACPGGATTE
jgi:hypothetical protein